MDAVYLLIIAALWASTWWVAAAVSRLGKIE